MDLLTGGVVRGLVGAATKMKLSDVSMGIYEVESKKLHPDMDKLNRSLGYASDAMSEANKEKEKSAEELKKAQLDAREEEKAERQAETQTSGDTSIDNKNCRVNKDGDTVTISEAGKSAAVSASNNSPKTIKVENVQADDVQTEDAQTDVKNADTDETAVHEVYSHSGKVAAMKSKIRNKISVRA